ncbi:MAG: MBL fold metallo-hydrolase [Burkholderiales bacterium]|nr:MBL fold metallo-hydrolase [Burkholderiales bacterium]
MNAFTAWSRIAIAALSSSMAVAAFASTPEPAPPEPRRLAEGAWWLPGSHLPGRQPDGNTVVFEGPEGLVVLDTGRHPAHRQAILDLARRLGKPVAAIVNSHWHLDHVSGNPALKAAHPGARVHASGAIDGAIAGFLEKSAASMREMLAKPGLPAGVASDMRGDLATIANARALRPDAVVAASGAAMLAGRELHLNLARDAATGGDVWLYDPATRIAAVGDLVTLPAPFLDTACVEGWKAALAQVWATPFETLVPGHGHPMDRAGLARYRNAFEGFTACASSSRNTGDCAREWSRAVAPLLAAAGQDPKRAEAMAEYYAKEVLRPNPPGSRFCRAAGTATRPR